MRIIHVHNLKDRYVVCFTLQLDKCTIEAHASFQSIPGDKDFFHTGTFENMLAALDGNSKTKDCFVSNIWKMSKGEWTQFVSVKNNWFSIVFVVLKSI